MRYIKLKYIKLFEDMNDDGYEEISYSSSRRGESIPPSQGDREFEILSKMGFIKLFSIDGYSLVSIFGGIYIYKYDDEWYEVVKIVDGYRVYKNYRCDQLDGLLNCLKNECGIE